MLNDILTVARKELQELFAAHTSSKLGLARVLIWIAVFGVLLPLQNGIEMMTSPIQILMWCWFPLFIVASVVTATFAGEREQHTLETLLASRLSDRAILFGKVMAVVAYGWGLTLLIIFSSLATFNIAFGNGQWLMYPVLILWGGLLLSLLSAFLASGLGILVSLRASTARQAQQSVSLGIMLLFFVLVFGLQALPVELQTQIYAVLEAGFGLDMLFVISGGLVLLSAILLGLSLLRFQRHKLILD